MKVPPLRLYHYWRSSSSWRVRWALTLKGVPFEAVAVNLLDDSTDRPEHRARNPLGFVPVLERLDVQHDPESPYLAESVAILEWLEEVQPLPSLFAPAVSPNHASWMRARARQLAEVINSGTQPLQNLNATEHHSAEPSERKKWMQHWIRNGLAAYERLVLETAGRFSIGNQISYPDLFLVPQCYNALRQDVPLTEFPKLEQIYAAALQDTHCQATHPDRFTPPNS